MPNNDALLAEAEQHEPNPAKVHICGSCGDPWPCLPARLGARAWELEADLALSSRREQNLDGLLTYLRTETARIVSQPLRLPSEVVDTVQQLKQYADGRDAELAALREDKARLLAALSAEDARDIADQLFAASARAPLLTRWAIACRRLADAIDAARKEET